MNTILKKSWIYLLGLLLSVPAFSQRNNLEDNAGNPPLSNRFRWGLTGGISLSRADTETFGFGNKVFGYGGLFADIPIYRGLSVRPEVTFRPHAYKGCLTNQRYEINAVYNRKDLVGAVHLRYTWHTARGKWLPYILLGPEFNWILDSSMESLEKNVILLEYKYQNHIMEAEKTIGVKAGVGVEYTLSSHHSLFFDIGYTQEIEKKNIKGICLTISLNL